MDKSVVLPICVLLFGYDVQQMDAMDEGQPVIKKLAPPRGTQKAQGLAPQAKSITRLINNSGRRSP